VAIKREAGHRSFGALGRGGWGGGGGGNGGHSRRTEPGGGGFGRDSSFICPSKKKDVLV